MSGAKFMLAIAYIGCIVCWNNNNKQEEYDLRGTCLLMN